MDTLPSFANLKHASVLQVDALEERLAAEAKLREDAEETLDRERRSAQMLSLASGSGDA